MKKYVIILLCFLATGFCKAQVEYAYPVKKLSLNLQGHNADMAYMDVAPANANGKTILLLHGKNFNGYYWKDVISFFTDKGYRVIVPDQIGWGKSDHPVIQYSFQLLAGNTKLLLDTLGIKDVIVVGHSMGGMVAMRFVLMYPDFVQKLILENPIGLEDYKTFVPYQNFDTLYKKEKSATYDSYKKYQQSYYPVWKPAYEQYVQAQAADLSAPDFDSIAKVNALAYEMIYDQPVCYEIQHIKVPTLLLIGQADRTVVGKNLLTEDQKKMYGQYPELGRKTHALIKNSVLVELPGVGHIPHIQQFENFKAAVSKFL